MVKAAVRGAVRLGVVLVVFGAIAIAPHKVAWAEPETRSQLFDVTFGQTIDLEFAATHVAVTWDGDPTAHMEVRGKAASGDWTTWQQAKGVQESGERPNGLVRVHDADQIEVRVLAGEVSNVTAQAIDTENGPRHLELVGTTEQAEAIDGATPMPEIIRRNQWGANESMRRGSPSFAATSRIVVHHTDTGNNDPNPVGTVRAILAFHTQSNGWDDIGYNFLIDQQGRIYEGRWAGGSVPGENDSRRGVIGAHAQGHNTGTVGISLLGNFTNSSPSGAQQAALARLIAWEGDRHNMDLGRGETVVGHGDVNQTSCPGAQMRSRINTVREDANAIKTVSYPTGATPGYWVAGAEGSVFAYGSAQFHGSMAGQPLNGPIRSMTKTANSAGYWLMGTDGGIFSFGNAAFHGSMGGKALNAPVLGLAPTPSGNGYWLVASDGGIFSFGDAQFFGSMGGKPLNKPIVGMSATPSGNGYWLVASDGGIFAYGDAQFYGSTGAQKLNQPIVSMSAASNGQGYTLTAADGGVFAFNTKFWGSIPMLKLASFAGSVQGVSTRTGNGYYMLSRNGGVYTFGDARFHGAPTDKTTAVSMAVIPDPA